jgi:site-specific recombinase XerD
VRGPRAASAAAATNSLVNGAEVANVQEVLRHANIQSMRIYVTRKRGWWIRFVFKISY